VLWNYLKKSIYNIVNDADLQLAAQKQELYLQTQIDTVSSTIHNLDEKRADLNGG